MPRTTARSSSGSNVGWPKSLVWPSERSVRVRSRGTRTSGRLAAMSWPRRPRRRSRPGDREIGGLRTVGCVRDRWAPSGSALWGWIMRQPPPPVVSSAYCGFVIGRTEVREHIGEQREDDLRDGGLAARFRGAWTRGRARARRGGLGLRGAAPRRQPEPDRGHLGGAGTCGGGDGPAAGWAGRDESAHTSPRGDRVRGGDAAGGDRWPRDARLRTGGLGAEPDRARAPVGVGVRAQPGDAPGLPPWRAGGACQRHAQRDPLARRRRYAEGAGARGRDRTADDRGRRPSRRGRRPDARGGARQAPLGRRDRARGRTFKHHRRRVSERRRRSRSRPRP